MVQRNHRFRYTTGISCLLFLSLESNGFVWTPRQPQSVPHARSLERQFPSLQGGQATLRKAPVSAGSALRLRLDNQLEDLCYKGHAQKAVRMLEEYDASDLDRGDPNYISEKSFARVIQSFAYTDNPNAADKADALLKKAIETFSSPGAEIYNAVIYTWSRSRRISSGRKCDQYLKDLWSSHEKFGKDKRFLPSKSSYISTISALAHSRGGKNAAMRCEELLEEMERVHKEYPNLRPVTICVNAVMGAWSKSGDREASHRCMAILNKTIELMESGRVDLAPDTTTFNIALDAIAKSGERDAAQTAETLLNRMDELANKHEVISKSCRPDQTTFNTVLNAWAQSRGIGAAPRAHAILEHMEHMYELKQTTVHPDTAGYSTVINAWARSSHDGATEKAEELLSRLEESYASGKLDEKPNTLTYNSLINCYSKSGHLRSAERAVSVLEKMKKVEKQDGFANCSPDVFTYTSVIDTIAKSGAGNASSQAEVLLEELEAKFEATGDRRMKPNVRTYTSVINAIGRSGVDPHRAEAIIKRMEQRFIGGDLDVRPDVVCYNALLNAYGWSNTKGKGKRCFEIYKHMKSTFVSGLNKLAKPDIISCNSVLNACAYDTTATSEEERSRLMQIVVETYEDFQSVAPKFGFPDHLTFGHVLLAASNHMPPSEQRSKFAEATFWQCCQSGRVSPLVVTTLYKVIPWRDFVRLMGPSLLSTDPNQKIRFDPQQFPAEWTRYASPSNRKKMISRPSRKKVMYPVTKSDIAERKRKSQYQ